MPVDNDDDNYIEPTESSMSLPTRREFWSFKLIIIALLETTVEKVDEINAYF